MKTYAFPAFLWVLFEIIAIGLWLSLDNIFYLLNFSYIGTCLAVGLTCYLKKIKYTRHLVQFAIGLYMLVYMGILSNENMQIEGFWYYIWLGMFEATAIHYAVAKIFGPFLFGRGWCGYACWTAMILDVLPYQAPRQPRKKNNLIRYSVFFVSLLFVGSLFVFHVPNVERIMFWSFILGNGLYYAIGICLAFALKDNRAFCKYICPITVFLKPASYYSLLRVKNDADKCVSCGKCKRVCPMHVDVPNNSRNRLNGTECILCCQCINECPSQSLHL